jgi:hypothetical protein
MENVEFAYLLGMIVGKGTIIRGNSQTDIIIEIPHKNLIIEDMDARLSVKASLDDIRNILEPLIDTRIISSSGKNKTVLKFTKDNENFLIREINRHLGNLRSCKDFRIPREIFSSPMDVKKEFIIGLSDVTAHIRRSNVAYGLPYHHRVYIEIPQNWFLVIDIANLLKDLDVPIHTIDWGHPNTRDPYLEDYKKGKTNVWFREHQTKIFADEFEKISFRITHKMKALKQLVQENRKEWDKFVRQRIIGAKTVEKRKEWQRKLGHIELTHHKFYWQTRDIVRPKPRHPKENDPRIPKIIRGKHFDSWKDISKALGYTRR